MSDSVVFVNPGYQRPRKLMLDDYMEWYESTFTYFNTVKRNGFHIVAEVEDESNRLVYKTHAGKPLTPRSAPLFQLLAEMNDDGFLEYRRHPVEAVVPPKVYSGTSATLAKIDEYLRATLNRFDPRTVSVYGHGGGRVLRFEFCVQERGTGKDNLQALFHGQWAKNPELYDVSIAVFDVEFSTESEGDEPSYEDRWEALNIAFPHHVVQRVENDIIHTLKHCEGIVTYEYSRDIPFKVKLEHPLCLRILAAQKSLEEHPNFEGFNRVYIGVESGENTYTVIDVIDYTDVLSNYEGRLQSKCYVNPRSIHRSRVTGRMECTNKGVLGPVLGELARVLDENTKVRYRDNDDLGFFTKFEENTVVTNWHETVYKIDRGRSFHFDKRCQFFINPPPIVVSPNEIWPLTNGVHLQATKTLAVGDYGVPLFQELYARPADMATLRRIAVEGLCQNPDEMNRIVFGRDVDLLWGF